MEPVRSNLLFGRSLGITLIFLVGLALAGGCDGFHIAPTSSSYPQDPQAVNYHGSGTEIINQPDLSGPVIVRIVTDKGNTPFQLTVNSGGKEDVVISGAGSLDEYRGYELDPTMPSTFRIQGDQPWTLTISPADSKYFSNLKIPGKFYGSGKAVLFLDGEYGVATFQLASGQDFTAWAFGPGGIGEQLYIPPSGDYKGKSVLPEGAGWIVVSTRGSWAVDIQAPCCKVPPGFKPTYP